MVNCFCSFDQEPEKRHSEPAHSGRSSSSIAAFKKRAASPPVTARWSKVSDNGKRRWATSWPPATTARRAMRPAPRIATCGGTVTSWANRPPNMPKFDKVMVWPRNSASGTERAPGIDREAEIDLLDQPALHIAPVVPGVECRNRGAAGNHRADQPDRRIAARRPGFDVGLVRHRRRSDLGMRAAHVDRHCPAHTR